MEHVDYTKKDRKISVMMDEDLMRKIREIQAELLPYSRKNVSFTKMVNQILKVSFAKQEEMKRSKILQVQYGLAS